MIGCNPIGCGTAKPTAKPEDRCKCGRHDLYDAPWCDDEYGRHTIAACSGPDEWCSYIMRNGRPCGCRKSMHIVEASEAHDFQPPKGAKPEERCAQCGREKDNIRHQPYGDGLFVGDDLGHAFQPPPPAPVVGEANGCPYGCRGRTVYGTFIHQPHCRYFTPPSTVARSEVEADVVRFAELERQSNIDRMELQMAEAALSDTIRARNALREDVAQLVQAVRTFIGERDAFEMKDTASIRRMRVAIAAFLDEEVKRG